MDPLFRSVQGPVAASVQRGQLASMAEQAGEALKSARQSVAVFEATSAGLIMASLQAVPGASAYTTCGAVSYSPKNAVSVLGDSLPARSRPADSAAYKQSKVDWTRELARRKRAEVGATWCIAESGACGPTFVFPDISTGFTAIFVSGPVEKGIFVESPHNDREENMWTYTQLALNLLAECVAEAAATPAVKQEVDAKLIAKEDRFNGVEVEVPESGLSPAEMDRELGRSLEVWKAAGKDGIWLKVPLAAASCVGPAVTHGFEYHHAKPDYALLTCWLPDKHNTLPKYGFHQIGVGGVVVNSKDEVLMVQERISPIPAFQGTWKLPGGLADPNEHFSETVLREVREETGITGSFVGVISLRHSHGYRFGQGDLYVLVKLRADREEIVLDPHELQDAQWMSRERIHSLVTTEPGASMNGKVSANNWKMIENALSGSLIVGTELPNSRGGKLSMLYSAPKPESKI